VFIGRALSICDPSGGRLELETACSVQLDPVISRPLGRGRRRELSRGYGINTSRPCWDSLQI